MRLRLRHLLPFLLLWLLRLLLQSAVVVEDETDLEQLQLLLSSPQDPPQELLPAKALPSPLSLDGVRALLGRRLPGLTWDLHLELGSEGVEEEETFWYRVDKDGVSVRGSSLSALTKGLGHFFLHRCGRTLLSWSAAVDSGEVLACDLQPFQSAEYIGLRYRYYLNQVTMGYSTTWWDCPRWEQELDWMALRGVNIVLAHIAQETSMRAVMRSAIRSYTSKEADLGDDFTTGEQYLSWHRMGNLQSVEGPPSVEYLKDQEECQHKLLARMRELGITPILPAFNGHIPRKLGEYVKATEVSKSSLWSGFGPMHSGVYRLNPESPLFSKIGKNLVAHQLKRYGHLLDLNNLYFSVDIFNEMDPSFVSSEELTRIAEILVSTIPPTAKIVMQMWCFAHDPYSWTSLRFQAFLKGFPPGRLLLLDLHGEKRPIIRRFAKEITDLGHMVVWCYLHNFGGSGGMAGEIAISLKQMNYAFHYSPLRETSGKKPLHVVQGVGLAMESIEQNELAYDTILEAAWIATNRSFSIPLPSKKEGILVDMLASHESLTKWVSEWAIARYPSVLSSTPEIKSAWICALNTVYSRPFALVGWGPTKSVIEQRPMFRMRTRLFQPTDIHYLPEDFSDECLQFILTACRNEEGGESLSFDVIDFVRQGLSDRALILSENIEESFRRKNIESLRVARMQMLHIIDLMDELLSLHPLWRVEKFWTPNAKTEGQRKQARMILTSWYSGNPFLTDYASHQLGGLIRSVYRKRWVVWTDALIAALEKNSLPVERDGWFGSGPSVDIYEALLQYSFIEASWISKDDDKSIRGGKSSKRMPICLSEVFPVAERALDLLSAATKQQQ